MLINHCIDQSFTKILLLNWHILIQYYWTFDKVDVSTHSCHDPGKDFAPKVGCVDGYGGEDNSSGLPCQKNQVLRPKGIGT